MALTGGLETGGGDGVAAAAAAGASLLEREPAAIAHGGDALKKHSLLKAEDALAALRHVVRPPPAARAALLLLLGRIRREMLPAFAPPGVLRACSCVVCCVLFALSRLPINCSVLLSSCFDFARLAIVLNRIGLCS